MKQRSFSILTLLVALAVNLTSIPIVGHPHNDPPAVAPETVGLAGNRLAIIRAVMDRHVAEKKMPGAMGLIVRHGKIAYQETFGMADIEAGKPMQIDTIHRIYSMSKPITSVAVMMLYEEGKFQLNDPVAKFLPEFAKMQVAVEEKDSQTGKRLLSRKTVQLLSSDNLGTIPGMGPGYGFGLGFAVSKAPGEAGMMGSPGEYNWGGAAGTKFWIDPQEDMIGIFMIQILPNTVDYGSEFRVLAYQSIAD